MVENRITCREKLVSELAEQLDMSGDEMTPCIDLTDQVVTFRAGIGWMGDDISDMLDGHVIVDIEPVSSREGFRIMEDFAAGRPEGQQDKLFRALSGRKPFRAFRYALEELGILNDWYAFKGEAYEALAEERLADSDIEFADGKIVCRNKKLVYKFSSDDDYGS